MLNLKTVKLKHQKEITMLRKFIGITVCICVKNDWFEQKQLTFQLKILHVTHFGAVQRWATLVGYSYSSRPTLELGKTVKITLI